MPLDKAATAAKPERSMLLPCPAAAPNGLGEYKKLTNNLDFFQRIKSLFFNEIFL